ncbi:uncharacterized protein LOC120125740 [Hibiscus syriacus]|uniref:uncharacterized protein LOC120125740 n=1 Tax=Hibiscus syriacus TaxID=106335 RepID=UPI0019238CD8|nr:uncharacterized protein LOC120125740 [Hibiscus syriacus]
MLDHKPDVNDFVEPRISGPQADAVIATLGFPNSHRVEATGFSGDIADRKGGTGSSLPCKNFQDFPMDYGIQDMAFHGPPYTWTRGFTHARLDRALCNSYWDELCPESIIHHLLRFRSNHHPILLQLHEDFQRRFKIIGWIREIANFTIAADSWNKSVFGYIRSKKRMVMACLQGVQKALQTSNSLFLHNLEASLLTELESLLDQEELLWRQRSREDWISLGEFVRHFKSLFSVQDSHRDVFPCRGRFPLNPSATWAALETIPSPDEIRSAINDMAPLKAPGYDGLHAEFFQKHWSTVGNSICACIQSIFSGGSLEYDLNKNVIVLIPKMKNTDLHGFSPH